MTELTTGTGQQLHELRKRRTLLVDVVIRLLREKPLGVVGMFIVIILFIVGVFADQIAPYEMNENILADRLSPPSANHILGADHLGRDVLSRVIYGARVSMYVGLGASSIGLVIATLIGLLSGYIGGKLDLIMQRFVDAWMCFPTLFIILTIMAVVGQGILQVIVVLGVLGGITQSRVIRSAAIGVKNNVYVEAGRAIGCTTTRMLFRHILPNIVAPLIILFTISMGSAIVAEASISFLGFGIPPPTPSWGGMLSGAGRTFLEQAPWIGLWPGVALAMVVYGINMFGDALRDLLDPRLRGGLGRYDTSK